MIKRMDLVLAFTIVASGIAVPQSPGGSRAYYNKGFKVGFRYPAQWKFEGEKSPKADESGWTSLAQVSPREGSYRGTRLHEANAAIAVGPVSEAALKCLSHPLTLSRPSPLGRRLASSRSTKFRAGTLRWAPPRKPTPIAPFMTAGATRLARW